MPNFRTEKYTIWRACERIGIFPPGVEQKWDDCNVWAQAHLIAYEQIRNTEDVEWHSKE